MTEPNGGGAPVAQVQSKCPFLYHLGFAWSVGLRSGFGHQISAVSHPIVTQQQLDEVAGHIARERHQLEPTHPDYLPEGAKVSILNFSLLHVNQPKVVAMPQGFDPRGGRRR